MSNSVGKKMATRITHAGRDPESNFGVVNPPVYHASTILKPTMAEHRASKEPGYTGYGYGRTGTPTSRSFEQAITEIYGAADTVVVSSGKAAMVVALLAVVKAGDHILVADSVYQPTRLFCSGFLANFGVETTYYDPTIGAEIESLIQDNTALIYTESPGSLTFELQDIPAIAKVAHAHDIPVLTDNTWGTAVYYDVFAHGVDIVIEAVTKYICGHSDVMMGVVVSNEKWADKVRQMAKDQGQCCGPDDLYLAQRGLRTMGARLVQNQANAITLAKWLEGRGEVKRVIHPALPSHPQHDLWKRDFTGSCGLFAFVLQDCDPVAVDAFIDGLEFFGLGASWGGYESLALPGNPGDIRTATEWTETGQLIRIHAGLEDTDDLIADLEAGFKRLTAIQEAK